MRRKSSLLIFLPTTMLAAWRTLEGSYSLTQNTYEILVYARPLGARTDVLVGYWVLK